MEECPQDLCLLLVIGLQLTSNLDINFLTFKKWKVLILARISINCLYISVDIGAKLLQLLGTPDNANNNLAMAEILFGMLKADFDMEIFPSGNT